MLKLSKNFLYIILLFWDLDGTFSYMCLIDTMMVHLMYSVVQHTKRFTAMQSIWNYDWNMKSLSIDWVFFGPIEAFFKIFIVICHQRPSKTHLRQVGKFKIKLQTNVPFLAWAKVETFLPHFSNFILDIFPNIFKSQLCPKLFYHVLIKSQIILQCLYQVSNLYHNQS